MDNLKKTAISAGIRSGSRASTRNARRIEAYGCDLQYNKPPWDLGVEEDLECDIPKLLAISVTSMFGHLSSGGGSQKAVQNTPVELQAHAGLYELLDERVNGLPAWKKIVTPEADNDSVTGRQANAQNERVEEGMTGGYLFASFGDPKEGLKEAERTGNGPKTAKPSEHNPKTTAGRDNEHLYWVFSDETQLEIAKSQETLISTTSTNANGKSKHIPILPVKAWLASIEADADGPKPILPHEGQSTGFKYLRKKKATSPVKAKITVINPGLRGMLQGGKK